MAKRCADAEPPTSDDDQEGEGEDEGEEDEDEDKDIEQPDEKAKVREQNHFEFDVDALQGTVQVTVRDDEVLEILLEAHNLPSRTCERLQRSLEKRQEWVPSRLHSAKIQRCSESSCSALRSFCTQMQSRP